MEQQLWMEILLKPVKMVQWTKRTILGCKGPAGILAFLAMGML